MTFACYPTAVWHSNPTKRWGILPVAGQRCLGLPGSPRRVTDRFAQLFLEAGVVLLPKLPFLWIRASPSILLSRLSMRAIVYRAGVLLPEGLLALAHLPRTGTADTVVLCSARDHAQLRASIALMPEHMCELAVL